MEDEEFTAVFDDALIAELDALFVGTEKVIQRIRTALATGDRTLAYKWSHGLVQRSQRVRGILHDNLLGPADLQEVSG